MTVFGVAALAEFAKTHAAARKPLARFLATVEQARWRHLAELKAAFPAADYTPSGLVIFNVGGNKYRLAVSVDFDQRALAIVRVMTHAEYDKETF